MQMHINPHYLSASDRLLAKTTHFIVNASKDSSDGSDWTPDFDRFSGLYRCHVCFRVWDSRACLAQHLSSSHLSEAEVDDDESGRQFRRKRWLKKGGENGAVVDDADAGGHLRNGEGDAGNGVTAINGDSCLLPPAVSTKEEEAEVESACSYAGNAPTEMTATDEPAAKVDESFVESVADSSTEAKVDEKVDETVDEKVDETVDEKVDETELQGEIGVGHAQQPERVEATSPLPLVHSEAADESKGLPGVAGEASADNPVDTEMCSLKDNEDELSSTSKTSESVVAVQSKDVADVPTADAISSVDNDDGSGVDFANRRFGRKVFI
jgi:hypothetical protein